MVNVNVSPAKPDSPPRALTVFRLTCALRIQLVLLILLIIQGCTNSKFVIGPLYNRLDNKMRKELYEMGDFNAEQLAAFEASLGTFHVWHRQSELPQYAELLRDIATTMSAESTTAEDINLWMDIAEVHSTKARECLPVNFLASTIKSLSDEQIDALQEHVENERAENRERYASRTTQERIERRISNTVKWTNRLGIDLNPNQRAMFLSAYKQQISLRNEYFSLSDDWNRQLFEMVRNKGNPEYETALKDHLAKLWRLLESNYPEQWQANRDLWKQTALRYVRSMTDEQRDVLVPWLNKMARTLVSISQDEPSFIVGNDSTIGCLVDSDKT